MNKNLKYLIYSALLSFSALTEIYASQTGSGDIEKEIKEQFTSYRSSILTSPASLGRYFSKEVNEIWLGYLLDNRSEEEALKSLSAVISRASFGRRIVKVYEFNVEDHGKDRATVDIIYLNNTGSGPYLYKIEYIKEHSEWKINKRLSDTTKPGKEHEGDILFEYK